MPMKRQSIRQIVKNLLHDRKAEIEATFESGNGKLDRLKDLLLFHDITVAQWLDGCTFSSHPSPQLNTAENQSTYYLPGLEAKYVHQPQQFPWVTEIEHSSEKINAELDWILENSDHLRATGALQRHPEKLVEQGQWEVFYLYRNGHAYEENLDRCPNTITALKSVPLLNDMPCGMVYFSILAPGTIIQRHKGPTNLRLRCHLGLQIPEQIHITVGNEVFAWQQNRCLILDDAFSHEVFHNGSLPRIVLCFDFWHPGLTADEINAIKNIFRVLPS